MSTEVAKTTDNTVARLDDHRPAVVYRPPTDIFDAGNKVVLELEMPGVNRKDIDITLEKHVLTVRGKAKMRAYEGWNLIYGEYGEGDYERAFSLSEHIDEKKIDAKMKNGLLRLELPKAATAKARKINVSAA